MVMLKKAAILKGDGTIVFENGRRLEWNDISEIHSPDLPPSIRVEFMLSFKENDLLLGSGGFVWATYSVSQAEIIQSTLLAQHINAEIISIAASEKKLYAIRVINESDVEISVNFIWQGRDGLRLKPDWVYPAGERNASFEQWLGGRD